MSNSTRRWERKKERELARALTRKGHCSRCQRAAGEHPGGNCPDGLGTFSWAMNREELASVIGKLEAAEAYERPELTRDEETVLDFIAEAALGDTPPGEQRDFEIASLLLGTASKALRRRFEPPAIAQATGLELFHVRGILESLAEKGYLDRHQGPAPS